MRYEKLATLGGWTFYRGTDHGFGGENKDRPIYGYTPAAPEDAAGRPDVGEWYASLEHAMVAAVGEKYTGRRGAGGIGVGTAADWFMRMIGAHDLKPAQAEGSKALASVLVQNGATADHWAVRRIEDKLAESGIVLAHIPTDQR